MKPPVSKMMPLSTMATPLTSSAVPSGTWLRHTSAGLCVAAFPTP
ncbi:hypothetical protein PF010_g23695 [Phytophthora fragariae]|uniref:Uncharacterized protein n=1 Tax=Phytophthora fragariae TaxID=53985 RepID=A0A6G0K5C8_9STRA|nr:hypothetical protein PF010_g23695 [Phytophthora fragariae]KAE9304080.1 hypothetical protein PF008_g22063 [Phytophthora fragariae]